MKNGKQTIDKGIPIPPSQRGARKYAFMMDMKKGDSVFMAVSSYSVAWQNARNSLGKGNFAVRKDGEGFRIWRTA